MANIANRGPGMADHFIRKLGLDFTRVVRRGPKVILQLMPFEAFDAGRLEHGERGLNTLDKSQLRPFSLHYGAFPYKTIYGLVNAVENAYLVVSNGGVIESVETAGSGSFIDYIGGRGGQPDGFFLYCQNFKREYFEALKRYTSILQTLDVKSPVYLSLTLTDVKNVKLARETITYCIKNRDCWPEGVVVSDFSNYESEAAKLITGMGLCWKPII